jgi:hypothetical protein
VLKDKGEVGGISLSSAAIGAPGALTAAAALYGLDLVNPLLADLQNTYTTQQLEQLVVSSSSSGGGSGAPPAPVAGAPSPGPMGLLPQVMVRWLEGVDSLLHMAREEVDAETAQLAHLQRRMSSKRLPGGRLGEQGRASEQLSACLDQLRDAVDNVKVKLDSDGHPTLLSMLRATAPELGHVVEKELDELAVSHWQGGGGEGRGPGTAGSRGRPGVSTALGPCMREAAG